MTRSVADAALMQNIMSGPHPLDHNTLQNKINIPQELGDVRSLRIAYSIDLGHYIVHDDVRRETIETLNVLQDAGAKITEVKIDWASEAIKLAHLSAEFLFAGVVRKALTDYPEQLSDYVPQLDETASSVTEDDYRHSLIVAGELWNDQMGPLFKNYDALITPGVSWPEVPAENWQKDKILANNKEITDTDTAMTALFNMFNRCPVLSVPAGMTDDGLPVGIQIVGRPYDDVTTFQIGQAIENHRPWSSRRPSI
jgi:Asp-tRNA(Asn)/Glu-tRNA(Gln) amidotransferase A subunit family amidase